MLINSLLIHSRKFSYNRYLLQIVVQFIRHVVEGLPENLLYIILRYLPSGRYDTNEELCLLCAGIACKKSRMVVSLSNTLFVSSHIMREDTFLYNEFGTYLRGIFGCKVQKITIDAGFTCPNRDGKVGVGGCTYCNNQTFNPAYCHRNRSVAEQMREGISFFAHKYPEMKYLAYFQAYTNTYESLDVLKQRYNEALAVDGCVGIVIGTRPDCMPDELLEYLAELSKTTFVLVEYGIESTSDATLLRINRGHDYACAVDAVQRTAATGIPVGAHIILGLPGEGREELMQQAAELSRLPLTTLKLHQLQIVRGTRMAVEYVENPADFHLFAMEDYIDTVIDYVERLNPNLVLERFASQSPKELLIAPDWGIKNHELVDKIKARMRERGTWQGRLYSE